MAQYATQSDLQSLGLPAAALSGITSAQQDAALLATGDAIDDYLRARHQLPLAQPFPRSIVRANVIMAAYDIMQFRGYNPDEFDAGFRLRYTDIVGVEGRGGWLRDLAAGRASLAATADASVERENRPRVQTLALREW